MILHIMYDEKIISRVISYFEEALPNGNKFIIIMARNASPKYVLEDRNCLYRVRYNSADFWEVVGDISRYDYVFIHNMVGPSIRFVCKINHPRIVWCVWGMDLYSGYLSSKGYELHYDTKIIKRFSNGSTSLLRKILYFFRQRILDKEKIGALNKISFICAYDGEVELLFKYYPESRHIKKKEFFYYPVDALIPADRININRCGDAIMIGNSASLNGNHQEVFLNLSKIDLKNRKLIVPLSYGNTRYKDYIIKEGMSLFGNLFCALTEYMPLDRYVETMQGAKTYIYGNYRQEGVGNIVMALCWGGVVFLNPRNVMLAYFRSLGCVLFSTEDLPTKLHYELSEEEKYRNKKTILDAFSKNRLMNCIINNFGPSSY